MPTNTHPPLLPALRRKAGFFALKAAAVLMLWFFVPMSVFKMLGSVGPVISWLLLLPFLASFLLWAALWLAPLTARLVRRYGPSAVPAMRSLTLATAKATRSGGQWAVAHAPSLLGKALLLLYQVVTLFSALIMKVSATNEPRGDDKNSSDLPRFHYGSDGSGPHLSPHLSGEWYVGDEEYYR